MSGDLYELPAGTVGVAFGIESRSEKVQIPQMR